MENRNKDIEKIRKDYVPRGRTKLDELKELDKKVKWFPSAFACLFGTFAALVLGVGMCLAMQVVGTSVMQPNVLTAAGAAVGCVGIVLCVANYFIYKALLKARKAKYGQRIVALSDELLNGEKSS